jgi:hypothetical protein
MQRIEHSNWKGRIALMDGARVKVRIRCNVCGEKFTLRGRREKGRIDTGFKQCLCNNTSDFEIEEER